MSTSNEFVKGGLYWIDIFSRLALWEVMPYLTDSWGFNLTDAAMIVNLFSGAMEILPLGMLFLADASLGYSRALRISNCLFAAGLGLLFVSTLGTCSVHDPACTSGSRMTCLCVALALTAIGLSGFKATADEVEEAQTERIQSLEYESGPRVLFNFCGVTFIPIAGAIALAFFEEKWTLFFGVTALCTLVSTLVLNNLFPRYSDDRPEGFPLESSSVGVSALWIAPLCLVVAICGIVSSIGDTYFIEQASTLRSVLVGPFDVPVIFLRCCYYVVREHSTRYKNSYLLHFRRWGPMVGIATALVFSVVCCVAAACIEAWRIDVVVSHGLIDKPGETVPMSIFWMLPPYLLLGLVDGFLKSNVELFINSRFSGEVENYATLFGDAVFGLGIMGNALSVYATKVITGKDGKTAWFGNTLNRSRLDKYYWSLAVISSVNLVILGVFAPCYPTGENLDRLFALLDFQF